MSYSFRHVFHIHRMRKELKEVYANQMIDKFAHSLVTVFVPVYLMTIGHSLLEALFPLVVVELVSILFAYPITSLASRLGLKHTILYRAPVTVIFILWLESLPYMGISWLNLFIVGLIWGISRTLYWVPFNSEFVENSDRSHRGEEVGLLIALPVIVSIGSPFFGGVILEFLGFYILFSLFMILMILSVVPFFLTKEYRKYFHFRRKDLNLRLGHRFGLAFFAQGFIFLGDHLLWPLYTYTVFNSIVFTGIVASLTALGVAFLTLLIGKVCDTIDKEKMLRLGIVGCFCIWSLKYFAATAMEFFILSFLGGIFAVLISIPLFASFSDSARDRNILNDVSAREIFLSIGRVAIVSLIAFTFVGFRIGLLVMAFVSLLLFLVRLGQEPVPGKRG